MRNRILSLITAVAVCFSMVLGTCFSSYADDAVTIDKDQHIRDLASQIIDNGTYDPEDGTFSIGVTKEYTDSVAYFVIETDEKMDKITFEMSDIAYDGDQLESIVVVDMPIVAGGQERAFFNLQRASGTDGSHFTSRGEFEPEYVDPDDGPSFVITESTTGAPTRMNMELCVAAFAYAVAVWDEMIYDYTWIDSIAYLGFQNWCEKHSYVEGKVTKEATYAASGQRIDYCETCGASKTVTITKKVPPKTSITSLAKGSKKFTVKWSKKSSITGYQIRYSTSSSMSSPKTVTITKSGTTSKTISKLKKKKKYYVQVRTYKTYNGKKYYSSWSTKKNVTTK